VPHIFARSGAWMLIDNVRSFSPSLASFCSQSAHINLVGCVSTCRDASFFRLHIEGGTASEGEWRASMDNMRSLNNDSNIGSIRDKGYLSRPLFSLVGLQHRNQIYEQNYATRFRIQL